MSPNPSSVSLCRPGRSAHGFLLLLGGYARGVIRLRSRSLYSKSFLVICVACFLAIKPMYAQAWQDFGNAIYKAAPMMMEIDAARERRKAMELENQRLLLQQEQRRVEMERQRQAQIEEERRRQAELQAQTEAQQSEEQARIQAYRQGYTGTGFFVSKSGHIITNAHVLGDYQFIIAKDSSGKIYELDILAIDKQNDLALLQAAKKTEGLPIMSAQSVGKGLKVYAIGYPQPGIQGTESKITDGIISSMTGLRNDNDSYQISVPIQAGNSGGPLVSDAGAVVGVIVATVNAKKFFAITGDIPQNVNFAIKPDILEGFMKANNVAPLRSGKAKTNPLGFADENTVMIAARPERFDIASIPSPGLKINKPQDIPGTAFEKGGVAPQQRDKVAISPESKQIESNTPSNFPANNNNGLVENTHSDMVRCKIGGHMPIKTLREKCVQVGGEVM